MILVVHMIDGLIQIKIASQLQLLDRLAGPIILKIKQHAIFDHLINKQIMPE